MTLYAPQHRERTRLPLVYLTRAELDRLHEYSSTLPTGATPGKRWRCRRGGRWWLGPLAERVHVAEAACMALWGAGMQRQGAAGRA